MSDRRAIAMKYFEQNSDFMETVVKENIERYRKGYAQIKIEDKDGNPRELHIEKGTMAADLRAITEFHETPKPLADGGELLLSCDFFNVCRRFGGNAFAVGADSFSALTVTSGEGMLTNNGEELQVTKGDTVFITADSGEIRIVGELTAIDSRI